MKELERFISKLKKKNCEDGMTRRVDELGRVVLPIEMRKGKIVEGETKVKIHKLDNYVVFEIVEDTEEYTRKIDELGRVVIIKEFRDELKWKEKDLIEIWNYEKYYILKKVENKCIFCNRLNKLESYKGKLVCNKCKEELVGI